MPAQAKSLEVTERYRSGMLRLRRQGQREAKRVWNRVSPDALDATYNVGLVEMTVSALQREAARLSSAYLATFIASETGEPERPPAVSVWDKAFGGGDLREALRSPVIKAKLQIAEGVEPRQATNNARAILVSDVGLFIDTAARESLREGMEQEEKVSGYQRAVKGTCEACLGAADGSVKPAGEELEIHPNCQCVAEPTIRGQEPAPEADQSGTQQQVGGEVPITADARVEGVVDDVSKTIEDLHRFPDAKPIDVFPMETTGRGGQFAFDHIDIATGMYKGKGVTPVPLGEQAFDLTHELGHFLDNLFAGGKEGQFISGQFDEAFQEFRAIAYQSDTIQTMAQSRTGVTIGKEVLDASRISYLTSQREIWARAYAQWVYTKAPKGSLIRQAAFKNRGAGWIWPDDEFGPIGKAVEGVLKAKGLL